MTEVDIDVLFFFFFFFKQKTAYEIYQCDWSSDVCSSDLSTLLDVLSMAGGVSGNVAPNIEILRGAYNGASGPSDNMSPKGYRSELIPVSKLFAEDGHSQVNPVIYPGDVVKVRSLSDGYIYISGEVGKPGSSEFRRPLTILQAVSCAGGASPIAAEDKCKIIRRDVEGRESEIIVDLQKIRSGKDKNLLLACNDTILVPVDPVKKFFNDVANLFQMGVRTGVDVTYDAGEKSVMHYHPDAVAVFTTDNKVNFTLPDGKVLETTAVKGQTIWTPAGEHLPENVGDKSLEVILVEMKD